MKPGGRLVVVEPIHDSRRNQSRKEQVAAHEISSEIVESELRAAGFLILRRDESFEPFTDHKHPPDPGGFWLIVARKFAK